MSKLVPVDTAAFERALVATSGPVAVLLSAPWCGPCRTFAPLVERITGELGLAAAKVDIDASPELGVRYGVRSVPTLLVLRDGTVAARQVGTLSEAALRRFLADAS